MFVWPAYLCTRVHIFFIVCPFSCFIEAKGKFRGGSGGGGGVLGAGHFPFWGTPKLHKERKNVARVKAKTTRVGTLQIPGRPPPFFPKSCICP